MKNVFILIAFLLCLSGLNAQASFEGKIVFGLTYSSVPEELEGMEALLPKEATMYLKGPKVHFEQDMGMAGTQVVVFDNTSNSGFLLMNLMGSMMAIILDDAAAQEAEDAQKVTRYDEFKTIAGYNCQKVKIETTDKEGNVSVTEAYFTREIPTPSHQFRKLEGMVLQHTTVANGMTVVTTAKSIKRTTVKDDLFSIPAGYETIPMQEFHQAMGGN